MLRHLGMDQIADRIKQAAFKVITAGTVLTRDLGGSATTTQFTDAIIKAL